MKQISVFHKGVITDLDYSKMNNQGLLFPTANVELINKDGQGMILTPVKGTREMFNITPGFIIIGATEYNSIAYIISHNPTTGEGEVGAFPYPETGIDGEYYKPLQNLNFGPMRSDVFNFSLKNPIGREVSAVQDYDGTVNIIFADGVNEVRIVNSGFDQEGNKKPERYYSLQTLKESIQLIKGLPGNQRIIFLGQETGGKLHYGNYFFFYRYVTESNNTSEFIAESKVISINKKIPENESLLTTGWNEESNKNVTFEIRNIDQSYNYIQFAYVRYLSGEGGEPIAETMLVDNLHSINGSTLRISITGFETHIPLDLAEILKPVNREDIPKSILQYDRRIWGANWKAKPINYDALSQHALNIRLSADDNEKIPQWDLRNYYSRPENSHKAGYFRGETYITGVTYILNNGYETERFPVTGIDAYDLLPTMILSSHNSNVKTNQNGVIRMPRNVRSGYISDETSGLNGKILRLVFNMDKANEWLSKEGELQLWIKENVRSVKFYRAERIPNRVLQGYGYRVFGRNLPDNKNSVSIPSFNTDSKDIISVIFEPKQPNYNEKTNFNTHEYKYDHPEENKIKSLFSPDYIFDRNLRVLEGEHYIENTATVRFEQSKTTDIIPETTKHTPIAGFTSFAGTIGRVSTVNNIKRENDWILPSSNLGSLRLVNKVKETLFDVDNSNDILYFDIQGWGVVYNRNINIAPYLGLEDTDGIFNFLPFDQGRVFTLFRRDPRTVSDITTIYSSELNLTYKQVTDEIYNIGDNKNNIVCYNGDSFVQLTFIKVRTWEPSNTKADQGPNNPAGVVNASVSATGYGSSQNNNKIKYAHGLMIGFITENEINNALRVKQDNQAAFYPALNSNIDIGETFTLNREHWAIWPYSNEVTWKERVIGTGIESYLLNKANSVTLSPRTILSYNPQIPKGVNHYKNRIRYTGQQEPNYPVLSYRMWDYNSKVDFDDKDGPIVKIAMQFGRLISVQEKSIYLHNTNQEESVPSSSGDMIIGVRSILSPRARLLSRFGTKHPLSVISARSGLYGWDWDNSVIWRVAVDDEGEMIARSVTAEKMIEKYLKDLHDKMSNVYNKGLKDELMLHYGANISKQEGLLTSYNPTSNEVLFYSAISGGIHETLRYSESLNEFKGTFEYPTRFAFNINNNHFSVPLVTSNIVYIHDKGSRGRFYNINYNPKFTFLVNGYLGEEQNMINIDKMFKSLEIESPNVEFIDKIEFRTLYQKSENNPFHDSESFWIDPVYNMSKWEAPINVANEGEGQFDTDSHMQGKWMIVTITCKKEPDILSKVFIKNIITKFITSNA